MWPRRYVRPSNILYLHELQTIAALLVDTEEMLARARSFGLGMVQANQGAYQLSGAVYSAITTNAKTKVIFQTGDAADARRHADDFGGGLEREDFSSLQQCEAIARVSTDSGVSRPLTMRTLPPAPAFGLAHVIRHESRHQYGEMSAQYAQRCKARRQVPIPEAPGKRRPPIGSAEG